MIEPRRDPSSDVAPLAIDAIPPSAKIGVASSEMLRIPHLRALFPDQRLVPLRGGGFAAYVGWGNRRSGRMARNAAERTSRPFALLEDGFLRSVGLGKEGAAAVGFVLDDCGVYYDASRPSRLEALIAGGSAKIEPSELASLELWRALRLSKYNLGVDRAPAGLGSAGDWIVLVDQVKGDASVAGAGATAADFDRLLAAAVAERGAKRLAVRIHPDVSRGRAQGYLHAKARRLGLRVIEEDVSSHAVLDCAAEIWTVSSALGFEAILRGVPTRTFATPFYAGWGLTEDRAEGPVWRTASARRSTRPSAESMFGAAFVRYSRYVDPVTRRALDFSAAAARIADWRAREQALVGAPLIGFGFSRWKRRVCSAALVGSTGRMRFGGKPTAMAARRIEPNDRVAVWGQKESAGFRAACRAKGAALLRVEDGFIRSVGLGSDLLPPGSIVIDDLGLYYDAGRPSRLERLILETEFDEALLRRAQAIRETIVERAISKYNVRGGGADLQNLSGGRRTALVAEQVPNDAALRYGAGDVAPNLGLLKAVRAARPTAFIAYKEHPDLVAGNRAGRSPRRELERHADVVISEGDLVALFPALDELHVVSSLAGFEALLRSVEVHAWGRPFYAGWGLTHDRCKIARRTRTVSLDALVAATLLLYPRYIDPLTLVPCSIEDFLDSLLDLMSQPPGPNRSYFQTRAARALRWLRGALSR